MVWHRACRFDEVEEGSPLGIEVAGMSIGMFRVGNECYAIHDICPHGQARLSQGYQENDIIECPLHQATFRVTSGEHLTEPADRDVAAFAVKRDGDDLLVDIPEANIGSPEAKDLVT